MTKDPEYTKCLKGYSLDLISNLLVAFWGTETSCMDIEWTLILKMRVREMYTVDRYNIVFKMLPSPE